MVAGELLETGKILMSAPGMIHHFAVTALESARQQRVDEQLLFHGQGLTTRGRWEGADLLRFLRALGTVLQDAFYGMAASPCPPDAAGLGLELMVLSESLGAALDRSCRFYALVTDGVQFRLVRHGETASIDIAVAETQRDPRHFLAEWHAVRWHRLSQWLIGEEIPLTRVEFMHSPQTVRSDYAQVFGENCQFQRASNRISFPVRYLERGIIRSVDDLKITRSSTCDLFTPTDIHRTWRNLLRSALRARLSRMAAIPTMEELAEEFGVSSQTLRRRLKDENSSYRKLKAEARREVVLDTISDDNLTLSQISLLAGFAETNGLVRAMKSWTGLSPSQFRKAVEDRVPSPADQAKVLM